MSRYFSRVDSNQPAIVHALRLAGASVEHLHAVGSGCPDLLCALANGETFLIEVKDGSKPPSDQNLTKDQVVWHARWRGRVHIVNSVDQALEVVAIYRARAA